MKNRRRINTPPSLFIVVNPVGSKFAKALQTSLRAQVVNPIYRVATTRAGRSCFHVTPRVLNKIEQLERFKQSGVPSPNFTTSNNSLDTLGTKIIFARTLINSTNGRGIVEFNLDEQRDIPTAPLYVAYIPKKAEYRVHVFGNRVIDIQQKKRRSGELPENRNSRVRNLVNGYVYCRDGITPPDGIADIAIRAVAACNYQYGAVDIIYNEKNNQCFVLEVNSRPGLLGTTLVNYANALINTFNLQRK